MTDPQRYPVETARKKIADILDGTQFRGEIAEITRRDKRAGYLVPPEWYDEAIEALTEKRRRATASPSAATAAPRQQVTQDVSQHVETVPDSVVSPPVAAMSGERVKELAEAAGARHPEWIEQIRQAHPTADELRLHYLIVEAGVRMGFRPRELDAQPSPEKEQSA
jgi:hypothetical protein